MRKNVSNNVETEGSQVLIDPLAEQMNYAKF